MTAVARTDLQACLMRLRETASIGKYANIAAMRDVKALSDEALELAGEQTGEQRTEGADEPAIADGLADLSAALSERGIPHVIVLPHPEIERQPTAPALPAVAPDEEEDE